MEVILNSTYVINMDKDIGRLEEFDRMMERFRWNYTRFSGIDGKKLAIGAKSNNIAEQEQLNMYTAMRNKYVNLISWLSNNEVGCLLSHVTLWEEVANNPNKNRIAIFEDDARSHIDGDTIKNKLVELYSYLRDNNIEEPDMLYLGKALDECINYEKVWDNVYYSTHPLCLHSYIITKTGAQKLLSMAPYSQAIDWIPVHASRRNYIKIMVFHPSVFFQDIFGTTSNLRKLKATINHSTECIVSQQHLSLETWEFMAAIITMFIICIILYIYFM